MKDSGPNSTVMSSTSAGSDGASNFLSPPKFDAAAEKLAWRQDIRYWSINVKDCADGEDGCAKGALCALSMILFSSLPDAKRQSL